MFSPSLKVSNITGTAKKIKRQYDVYKLSGLEGLASNAVTSLIRAYEVKKLDVLENIPFMERKAEASKQKLEKIDEINNLVEEQIKLFSQLRKQLSKSEGVDLNVVRLLNKSILNISGSINQRKSDIGQNAAPELGRVREILNNILNSQNISIEEIDNSSESQVTATNIQNESLERINENITNLNQQVSATNIQNESLERINENITTLNRQSQTTSTIADNSERISQQITSNQNTNKIIVKESNKNIKELLDNSEKIITILNGIRSNLGDQGGFSLPGVEDIPGLRRTPRVTTPVPVGRTGIFSKIGKGLKGAGGKIVSLSKGVGGGIASLAGRAAPALAAFATGTAGTALGVAAGGALAGTGINYGLSKYIQKVTNNRLQNLGQVIESAVSERKQLEEKDENIRKWRNRLSTKAFELAGGDKNFSPSAVITLKNAGELVRQDNIFVTRNEVSSELPDSKEMMASTVKPEVKPTEVGSEKSVVPESSAITHIDTASVEKPVVVPEIAVKPTATSKSSIVTPTEVPNEIVDKIAKSSATPVPIATSLPNKIVKYEKDSKSTETILNSIDNKITSVNKGKSTTPVVLPKNVGGGTPYSRARRDSIADYGIDLIRTSLA